MESAKTHSLVDHAAENIIRSKQKFVNAVRLVVVVFVVVEARVVLIDVLERPSSVILIGPVLALDIYSSLLDLLPILPTVL